MADLAPRRLVAGNWKMNHKGGISEAVMLRRALLNRPASCDVAICPPATLISALRTELAGSAIRIGGQDCRPEPSGAFTGDLSAEALKDAGAELVILGHSERRHGHGESDELVSRKVQGALRAGLSAIVCVGETDAERDGGKTLSVVGRQIAGSIPDEMPAKSLIIAYEPVWAIGSGKVPSNLDIESVHDFIRRELSKKVGDAADEVPILYGGSVKPANAAEILRLKNVDGALVGGASLMAADFVKIVEAA